MHHRTSLIIISAELILLVQVVIVSGVTSKRSENPFPVPGSNASKTDGSSGELSAHAGKIALLGLHNWPLIPQPLAGVNSISDREAATLVDNHDALASESSMDGSDLDPDDAAELQPATEGSLFTLHKCCAFGEQLHRGEGCVTLPGEVGPAVTDTYYSEPSAIKNGSSMEIPDWIPTSLNIGGETKPFDHLPFNPVYRRPTCPFNEMMLVDQLNLTEAGDLQFQGLSLSSHDFCVDTIRVNDVIPTEEDESSYGEAMAFVHAVIICPCGGGGGGGSRGDRSGNAAFCVNKCCHNRETLETGRELRCVPEPTAKEDLISALRRLILTQSVRGIPNITDAMFYVQSSHYPSCKHGKYLLNSNKMQSEKLRYSLTVGGHIRLEGTDVEIRNTDYCIDLNGNDGGDQMETKELQVIGCRGSRGTLEDENVDFHELLYRGYYATGATFLGLTIFIHLIRPELRKSLHSYNFIAHNTNLFAAYLTLVFSHFTRLSIDPIICRILAFVTQFFFLSTFFWLSVMCFDISSAFGHGFLPKSNSDATVKFIKYAGLAWGMAAIICGLTALVEYTPILTMESPFKPNFGKKACWFKDDEALALFFYGPIGTLLVLNLIQYMVTVWRITAARRDTRVLRHSPERHLSASSKGDTQWFLLYGKLFCLMGGTWLFEVISWAIGGPKYIWYLPDGINALRGAGIFFIFLWQKRFFHRFTTSINASGHQSFANHPTSTNSNSFSQKKRGSLSNVRTSSIQLSQVRGFSRQKISPNINVNNNNKYGPNQ